MSDEKSMTKQMRKLAIEMGIPILMDSQIAAHRVRITHTPTQIPDVDFSKLYPQLPLEKEE